MKSFSLIASGLAMGAALVILTSRAPVTVSTPDFTPYGAAQCLAMAAPGGLYDAAGYIEIADNGESVCAVLSDGRAVCVPSTPSLD